MMVGTEWLVEATGCKPDSLRNESLIRDLFVQIVNDLDLKPVGEVWHKFPGEGGLTGMVALTESHLTCHTYPEHGIATFNLYCCRSRQRWNWEDNLKMILGAVDVTVITVERGDGLDATSFETADSRSSSVGGNW